MLTLEDAAFLILSLMALSLVSGVLVAVTLQTERGRVNLWFALFCFTLLIWSVGMLAGEIDELRFGLDERLRYALLGVVIGAVVTAFYAYVFDYCGAVTRWARPLRDASPVLLAIGGLLLMGGAAFSVENALVALQPAGWLAVVLLAAGSAASLLLILMSGRDKAARLRLAGLLMVAGSLSVILLPFPRSPVALVLMAVAAFLTARTLIPGAESTGDKTDLHQELRVANRDLAQALSDLALERAVSADLNDQLESAGRSRAEFLERLSVRLRTALNTIAGYGELLESGVYGELNEKQTNRVQAIVRSSDELRRLINNMIDLNLLDAGRMDFNPAECGVADVVDEALQTVETLRAARGMMIRRDLPEAPISLYADRPRVVQALHEIIDNAIRFSPKSPDAAVTVRARPVEVRNGRSGEYALPVTGWLSDGHWVLFEIIDQGIGIPSALQSQIFEPFFQVDSSTADTGGGLGLSVAQRLIALHEGVIWVKSGADEGTTVSIALRAARQTPVS
ncbi:HAMP domain-containing sensor histidine kinase [Kamptonema cortianum]|nr:HAMP domain-containing sensor histidine kinase [Kamptonema cortianum]